jgi:tetratricopeptide (TPR) repeat protein
MHVWQLLNEIVDASARCAAKLAATCFAGALVLAAPCFAQQPGDTVQARRNTPLTVDGREIDLVSAGSIAMVEKVEKDLLWCWTTGGAGWLASQDMITCQEGLKIWKQQIDEGDTDAYFHLAIAQDALGKIKEAIDSLDQYLKSEPDSPAAITCRGACWLRLGEPNKAERDFSSSLDIAPDVVTYVNRANAWLVLGDGRMAIEDCVKALLMDPEKIGALVNRGNAQRLLGRYDQAIADYQRALEFDHFSFAAYRNYALLRGAASDAKFRDGSQAVELAKKACDATGYQDALSLSSLAVASAEAGDWDSAIKWQNWAILREKLAKNQAEHKRRLELFGAKQPYRLKVGEPVPDD